MGLQRETISRGANGLYVQAIFAVALEVLLFGVLPSLLSVLGATIIISSAIYAVVSGSFSYRLLQPLHAHSSMILPAREAETIVTEGPGRFDSENLQVALHMQVYRFTCGCPTPTDMYTHSHHS